MSAKIEDPGVEGEPPVEEHELAKTIVNFEQTIVNFSAGDAPSSRKIAIIEPGYVFLERYRVKDELGKGAMGVVYLCEDEVAGIDVALKAIPPEIANDQVEMESVRENFQIVHKLHHPNIANINTLERDRKTGDYYLIMECVPGVNLWQYYKAKGFNPSLSMVMPVLKQIASALDYAHDQEIIHRDIKPSNIQIMDDATVKILDYGLAQQIQSSMMRVTGHSYSKGGTPFFMAPEQWKGTHQDGTTDQYALAVVIYQVVTGKCPFQSTDMMVLREMVLNEKPPKPGELTDIEWKVLRKALDKERIGRYKTCMELVEQLERAVTMTSSAARHAFDAPHTPAARTGPGTRPFSHRDARPGSRSAGRHRATGSKRRRSNVRPEPSKKALIAGAILMPVITLGLPGAGYLAWSHQVKQFAVQKSSYQEFMGLGIAAVKERDWGAAQKFASSALATGWPENDRAKKLLVGAKRHGGIKVGAEKVFAITDEVSIRMRWIAPGSFTQGSFFNGHYDEEPARQVMLTEGYWIGETEVTQQQWNAVVGHNPSFERGDQIPVDNVKWDEAVQFCEQLSARLERTVRLPTEAEWEYACRAGKHTSYSFGNDAANLAEFANYCEGANGNGFAWQDLSSNDGFDKAAPVASFKPNAWGLYDMMGNVSEWCQDYYGAYSDEAYVENPTGPETGLEYVARGGSWASAATYCRAGARRDFLQAKAAPGSQGLRIVIEPSADELQ